MKAIPLDELIRKTEADMVLLDTLIAVAEALQTPARPAVLSVLVEQLGACALSARRWEAKALVLEHPTGVSG